MSIKMSAAMYDMLQNIGEGAGGWCSPYHPTFCALQRRGLVEYAPGAPPEWRITEAGRKELEDAP